MNGPIDNQPRSENVETLEGMEAHFEVSAEAFHREYHHGRDPAHDGHVTQDGKRSIRDFRKRIHLLEYRAGVWERAYSGLAITASRAIGVRGAHMVPALAAKGHL